MFEELPFSVPVFLAPMSGVTDLPFRRQVRKFGAGLVYSEMIASRMMIDELRHEQRHTSDYREEFPLAAQIAGCDPEIMAEAAKLNEARGAAMIDINFGCPVKKVVNAMAGSALMRDLPLATKIMESVVESVRVPVSVKMRLGWDENSLNAPELARIAEATGIKMITVHGRTRQQLYNGTANWPAVKSVKSTVKIPVIINGDVASPDEAKRAQKESGADGVMIGRAACGQPWILRQVIDGMPRPDLSEIKSVMIEHYQDILSHYGTQQGLKIGRKHLGWYLKNWPEDMSDMISIINCSSSCDDVLSMLTQLPSSP